MTATIPTLHHVTATAAEAPADVRFYTRILGLRLVKKTVNFDNNGVYHFYYGDERGRPSTLMTTFPYAGKGVRAGVKGAGQITVTSFSVPPGSLEYWQERFTSADVVQADPVERFGQRALMVEDSSGLNIELVESDGDEREPWHGGGVDPTAAIRGLHGATFVVRAAEPSVSFLVDVLGFRVSDRAGNRTRLAGARGGPGSFLEVLESAHAPDAVNGIGTVHHVALAIADERAQAELREELVRAGRQVSEVRDRQYFRSIYFREPGGILYEVATEGPGFTVDEDVSELGATLKLPPWEEPNRSAIESALPSIENV